MNDTLIDRLTQLDLEEKSLKRNLDKYYCSPRIKTRLFKKIKEIKKERERIIFKLRLERELKNENNNTD